MTGRDLAEKVVRKVDDPDVTDVMALDVINEGLLELAEAIRLPWLEQYADLDTELATNYVDMPEDYHRGLYQCMASLGRKVQVIDSRARMLSKVADPASPGRVVMACEVDGQLMYWPVPEEAETLRIFYYRLPPVLTFRGELGASGAVRRRVENALFHYTVAKFSEEIEDGMEGQKVNTTYHLGMYASIVNDLRMTVEAATSMPSPPVVKGCYQ